VKLTRWTLGIGLLLTALRGQAGTPSPDPLIACLAGFADIHWQLPYQPYMHVQHCASPGGLIGGGTNTPGRGDVEFVGDALTDLPALGMSYEVHQLDTQNAVFAHFDHLLRSQHFTRISMARDDKELPFVTHARYVRQESGGKRLVEYESKGGNVWRLLMFMPWAP
jgi:hypothetical protein